MPCRSALNLSALACGSLFVDRIKELGQGEERERCKATELPPTPRAHKPLVSAHEFQAQVLDSVWVEGPGGRTCAEGMRVLRWSRAC